MDDSKYSKDLKPFGFNGGARTPKSRVWGKLHYNVGLIILAGVSALIIMFGRESSEGSTGLIEEFRRMIAAPTIDELHQRWDYSSYKFLPNISDWDEQRLIWLAGHLNLRPRAGGNPWIMMVSGSSPSECDPTILSHLFLRASKNKLDYCREHDIEFFYNLGEPDQEFSDWWVKLPVIRMLMLQNPQVEWIWWIDADAIITDLSFEPPYRALEQDNLVLFGDEHQVYDKRTWTGLSTANFMIRNCQWSLDLLDEWASMGIATLREEAGKFQSALLADRPADFPGDDQAGLVALLAQDKRNRIGKQRWAPMVKLVQETEFQMAANWADVGPNLEELGLHKHDRPVPFVTHFAGCLPSCTFKPDLAEQVLQTCVEQMGRAFDFADNHVYQQFGFEPRKLGDHLEPLDKKKPTEPVTKDITADGEEVFRLAPWYSDWDERRLAWMQQHPPTARDEVLLVSGSAPNPCAGKLGSHFLLRGLKNLIDYSRKNDVILFYNNAAIDRDLAGWWSKLPLLKMLMVANPGVEWVWWLDSDAVITDVDYRFDFARYNASGYNLVMYGAHHELFDKKSYVGINTGNLLIRNCQWSLDMLDRWGSFGATEELRKKSVPLLSNLLSDRTPEWDADDQSVLAYLLIAERPIWAPKICLETTIAMSGSWDSWTAQFRDEHPAADRPFVTHFAGCKPCRDPVDEMSVLCLIRQDIAYHFADNQVLGQFDLRHVHLNSTALLKRSSIDPQLLEPQQSEGSGSDVADSTEPEVATEAAVVDLDSTGGQQAVAATDAVDAAEEEGEPERSLGKESVQSKRVKPGRKANAEEEEELETRPAKAKRTAVTAEEEDLEELPTRLMRTTVTVEDEELEARPAKAKRAAVLDLDEDLELPAKAKRTALRVAEDAIAIPTKVKRAADIVEEEEEELEARPAKVKKIAVVEPEDELEALPAKAKRTVVTVDPEDELEAFHAKAKKRTAVTLEPEEELEAVPAKGKRTAVTIEPEEELEAVPAKAKRTAVTVEPEEELEAVPAKAKRTAVTVEPEGELKAVPAKVKRTAITLEPEDELEAVPAKAKRTAVIVKPEDELEALPAKAKRTIVVEDEEAVSVQK